MSGIIRKLPLENRLEIEHNVQKLINDHGLARKRPRTRRTGGGWRNDSSSSESSSSSDDTTTSSSSSDDGEVYHDGFWWPTSKQKRQRHSLGGQSWHAPVLTTAIPVTSGVVIPQQQQPPPPTPAAVAPVNNIIINNHPSTDVDLTKQPVAAVAAQQPQRQQQSGKLPAALDATRQQSEEGGVGQTDEEYERDKAELDRRKKAQEERLPGALDITKQQPTPVAGGEGVVPPGAGASETEEDADLFRRIDAAKKEMEGPPSNVDLTANSKLTKELGVLKGERDSALQVLANKESMLKQLSDRVLELQGKLSDAESSLASSRGVLLKKHDLIKRLVTSKMDQVGSVSKLTTELGSVKQQYQEEHDALVKLRETNDALVEEYEGLTREYDTLLEDFNTRYSADADMPHADVVKGQVGRWGRIKNFLWGGKPMKAPPAAASSEQAEAQAPQQLSGDGDGVGGEEAADDAESFYSAESGSGDSGYNEAQPVSETPRFGPPVIPRLDLRIRKPSDPKTIEGVVGSADLLLRKLFSLNIRRFFSRSGIFPVMNGNFDDNPSYTVWNELFGAIFRVMENEDVARLYATPDRIYAPWLLIELINWVARLMACAIPEHKKASVGHSLGPLLEEIKKTWNGLMTSKLTIGSLKLEGLPFYREIFAQVKERTFESNRFDLVQVIWWEDQIGKVDPTAVFCGHELDPKTMIVQLENLTGVTKHERAPDNMDTKFFTGRSAPLSLA